MLEFTPLFIKINPVGLNGWGPWNIDTGSPEYPLVFFGLNPPTTYTLYYGLNMGRPLGSTVMLAYGKITNNIYSWYITGPDAVSPAY